MRIHHVMFVLFALSGGTSAAERILIEEIIITAQRIEERASKVPIAVTAFDDAMMRDRRIVGLSALQLLIPNLNYTTNNVADVNISIRGVGSLVSINDGEAGVSLHINEIPLAPGQPPIELYDVQRLEALRGPQGTLYGRNATGGVINIITMQPSYEGLEGYVDIEAGDVCSVSPGHPIKDHWGISDPAGVEGAHEKKRQTFLAAYRDVEQRVSGLSEPIHENRPGAVT
jgi:outer membrane receptor protein involved in Fe transport